MLKNFSFFASDIMKLHSVRPVQLVLGRRRQRRIWPRLVACCFASFSAETVNLSLNLDDFSVPRVEASSAYSNGFLQALAKQCVVFNCSPEMDYIMVGKFFKGAAAATLPQGITIPQRCLLASTCLDFFQ